MQSDASLGVGSVLMKELKEKKDLWKVMGQALGEYGDMQDPPGLRQQLLKCRELANASLLEIKDTVSKQIIPREKALTDFYSIIISVFYLGEFRRRFGQSYRLCKINCLL